MWFISRHLYIGVNEFDRVVVESTFKALLVIAVGLPITELVMDEFVFKKTSLGSLYKWHHHHRYQRFIYFITSPT